MATYLEFEVSLLGVEPRIWRRFLIAGGATFLDLHNAIQAACGWENKHIYQFRDRESGRIIAGRGHHEPGQDKMHPAAEAVSLRSYFRKDQDQCLYWYDPGDNWEHVVELKKVAELAEGFFQRLTGGARAFPLEHCGGVVGYRRCLRALGVSGQEAAGPEGAAGARLESLRAWIEKSKWQPERFDLLVVKQAFDR